MNHSLQQVQLLHFNLEEQQIVLLVGLVFQHLMRLVYKILHVMFGDLITSTIIIFKENMEQD